MCFIRARNSELNASTIEFLLSVFNMIGNVSRSNSSFSRCHQPAFFIAQHKAVYSTSIDKYIILSYYFEDWLIISQFLKNI